VTDTRTENETDEQTADQDRQRLRRGQVFVSWCLLRSIGNSKAAKLTILIPLIGYLILLNEDVISHLELSKQIFGAPADATLTRLLLIYCGLVFVAVASTIFAIACPLEVKRYASSEEYIAGDERFQSQRTIGVIQTRLRLGDEIARNDDAAYRHHHEKRPTSDDIEVRRRRAKDLIRIQMNLYFEMLDRSRPFWRWAAAICYFLGIGLLLIPATIVFLKVMIVLGPRLRDSVFELWTLIARRAFG
jgi:hypothetical protein